MEGADEVGVEGALSVVLRERTKEYVHHVRPVETVLRRPDVREVLPVAVVLHDRADGDVEFDYLALVGCGGISYILIWDRGSGERSYQRRFS